MGLVRISHTLDNEIGAEDSHAANSDTGLSGTIGSSKAGEDDGGRAAQRTKEGLEMKYQYLDWDEVHMVAIVAVELKVGSRWVVDGKMSGIMNEEARLTA